MRELQNVIKNSIAFAKELVRGFPRKPIREQPKEVYDPVLAAVVKDMMRAKEEGEKK